MATQAEVESERARLDKWYGAGCPIEIGREADALYRRLVGLAPGPTRPTPGHAGLHLMDQLLPRGLRRQAVSAWPPPVLATPPVVRDINWTDPTAADAPGYYLHAYDRHGSDLALPGHKSRFVFTGFFYPDQARLVRDPAARRVIQTMEDRYRTNFHRADLPLGRYGSDRVPAGTALSYDVQRDRRRPPGGRPPSAPATST